MEYHYKFIHDYYHADGYDYGTNHHHHGPGDNDILVHNHDAPNEYHFHTTTPGNHSYGPADHNHHGSAYCNDLDCCDKYDDNLTTCSGYSPNSCGCS